MENVIERGVEHLGDLERHLEGWGVPATLDGDDGLARHADALGEVRLCHLAVLKPQRPNRIGDLRWLDHRYNAPVSPAGFATRARM